MKTDSYFRELDQAWERAQEPVLRTYTPCGVIGVQVDDYTRYTWERQKFGTIRIIGVADPTERYFWYFWEWMNCRKYDEREAALELEAARQQVLDQAQLLEDCANS